VVTECSAHGIVSIGLPAGCNDNTFPQDADFDISGRAEGGLNIDFNTLALVDAEVFENGHS